jgi:CHASE3 domain sensor protein
MRQSTGYGLGLLGAVIVVFLNVWLAFHAVGTLFNAQNWQSHTLEVISQTEGLVAQVRTAESAARGYILTGTPSFEAQYLASTQGIAGRIDHISALTSDNASQQQRLVELRTCGARGRRQRHP